MQDNNNKSGSQQGKSTFIAILIGLGGLGGLGAILNGTAALLPVLNQLGWLGTKPTPSSAPSSTPSPNQPSTLVPVNPLATSTPETSVPSLNEQAFRIKSNDGFAAVRRQPTTNSYEIDRQTSGTVVYCGDIVQGQELWSGNQWRYCKKLGGFIYSPLLKPTER